MKKLISLVLALILVVSMATVAFAADNTSAILKKNYVIVNDGAAPKEEFTFNFAYAAYYNTDGDSAEPANKPDIDSVKINYADDVATSTEKNVPVSVSPALFDLGTYFYTVTEVDANTEGVTYGGPYVLKLQIMRDEQDNKYYNAVLYTSVEYADTLANVKATAKNAALENKYESGALTVTKKITGSGADLTDTFTIVVKIEGQDGDTVRSSLVVNGASEYEIEDNVVTIKNVANNTPVTITNIPAGAKYTVSETEANENGYTTSYSGETGTMTAGGAAAATVTNNREVTPDTGISLDSIPFVLMLVVCAGAAVLFVTKRRSVEF